MSNIPKPELIKIVVTGHTNSGKTTMIQTLIKKELGQIADRANVTQDIQTAPYEYEGLQAIFIDTPGFQQANRLLDINKGRMKLDAELEEELKYEIRAFEAIQTSNAILYIVSLDSVPDASDQKEIELVISTGKGVVALLNKGIYRLRASQESDGESQVQRRIEQWKELLESKGVSKIFEFDAHWYNPAKVIEIYNAIEELLPEDKSNLFQESLSAFREYQENKMQRACELIFRCLDRCRQPVIVQTAEFNDDTEKSQEEAVLKISQLVYDAVMDFLQDASDLYYEVIVPLNIDHGVIKNLEPNTRIQTNIRDFLVATGATASGLAALGTTFGAAVGASASAILTGGVGAISGGWIGAQIGSVIGTFVGGAWGIVDHAQRNVTAKLSSQELNIIQCTCLTTIWALAQHGFGVGTKVDEAIMARRHEIVKGICNSSEFNWLSANEKQVVDQCRRNLDELSNIALASIAD